MDILELSRKMEGDLLNSGTKNYCQTKLSGMQNFSPRQTRSKTGAIKKPPTMDNSSAISELNANEHKVNEVKNVSLNKKHKGVNKNLETIYETPIWRKGSTMLLGNTKIKRSLHFDREFRRTNKVKSKLRKIKIKKMGKKFKLLKMSDDEFKNKMMKIENFINETEVCSNKESCDKDAHMENHFDSNFITILDSDMDG